MKTDTQTRKGRILKATIQHKTDDCADTDTLGQYKDTYSGVRDEWAIVRVGPHAGEFVYDLQDTEDWLPERSREFRFYYPPVGYYLGLDEKEMREYCLQDYARMESLNRGDWYYVGVIAVAEITLPESTVIQRIRSGGLWGVESDAGEYFKEVEAEQLAELAAELGKLGFGKRAIDYAIKNAAHKDA